MKGERGAGKLVALGSIVLNGLIFVVKAFIGIQVGSLALLSDAIHTISDSASSVAVYVGLKVGDKPPDESHPFGHGRADQVAVLAVGIILFFTALIFLSEGIESLIVGIETITMRRIFYVYIFLTAIAKEVMGELSYFVGKKIDSDSLKADAWHHRADAATTMLVIGAIYASQVGLPFLDPLAGIGIALAVGYISISYIKKSTDRLLGTKPSSELLGKIEALADEIEGVEGVHDIKIHDYGGKKVASLHMKVKNGAIRAAHRKSHELKDRLEESVVSTAEIHLDPSSLPSEKIKGLIEEKSQKIDGIIDVHQIDISESEDNILVSMHLVLPKTSSIEEGHEIGTFFESEVEEKIKSELKSEAEVQVHIEPCQGGCADCKIEDHDSL